MLEVELKLLSIVRKGLMEQRPKLSSNVKTELMEPEVSAGGCLSMKILTNYVSHRKLVGSSRSVMYGEDRGLGSALLRVGKYHLRYIRAEATKKKWFGQTGRQMTTLDRMVSHLSGHCNLLSPSAS